MKKSLLLFSLFSAAVLLSGYGPRSYSDLATYGRTPIKKRVEKLINAGEDLFLRHRYEDSKSIFNMALALEKDNLKAKLWISKINFMLEQEKNEKNKMDLYQKYGGHLTPIDKIYNNWHWGPEVGHFEVRYSEPKPYVPAVRKFRPRATEAEIKEALALYQKSGKAEDAFELAMRYWSQRKKEDSIKYYFEAVDLKPKILGLDDEYMLSMISEELEEKMAKGSLVADEYLIYGRLALIQGNLKDGANSIIKAAMKDKKLKELAGKILESYVSQPVTEAISVPAEIYSFRQAYVFDKGRDAVYMRIILSPRDNNRLVPIDTSIPASYVASISPSSKDIMYSFEKSGLGDSARIWVVLPEKEGDYPEYEIRLIVNLKRYTEEESDGIELSNYALPAEQDDNWSLIISSEFNDTEGTQASNYEKIEKGVRVSGYHLGSSSGRGPYIMFRYYKEPLPSNTNVWKIIENKEGDMSLL